MLDDIDLFEAEVALELLEESGIGVEARHECGGDAPPSRRLVLCEGETSR